MCCLLRLKQFSNSSVHQNHLEGLKNADYWSPPLKLLMGGPKNLPNKFQVMLMLLVQGPHFENHCSKVCSLMCLSNALLQLWTRCLCLYQVNPPPDHS